MVQNWYALQTKPNKERFVLDQLRNLGVEHYFPTIVNDKKEAPFFPAYIFIQADLDEHGCDSFNYMRGSKGLVQFGEWPEVVSGAVIDDVKTSVAAFAASQEKGIQPGAKVTITAGVLAGYEGVFERYQSGKERVLVLLSVLSKSVSVGAGQVAMVG